MQDTFRQIWENIYLRVLFIVTAIYAVFWLLKTTQIAWTSFLIAFLIAYLVEPIVSRLENTRVFRRWMSVTFVIIFILLFFTVSVLLTGEVLVQLSGLPGQVIPLIEQIPDWLDGVEEQAPPLLATFLVDNTPGVQTFIAEQQRQLTFWAQREARQVVRLIGTVFGGLGRSLFILALAGFIISSYSAIQRSVLMAFPQRYHAMAKDLAVKLDKSVGGYIRAKVLEAIIVGFGVWIVLLVMNIPTAAPLAFLAAVLNPIPYLGPSLASLPIVLSALTVSWPLAVVAFFVMGIIQVLDGNILAPILLAQSVSVHPVTVLLALVIGGALLGLWGVILAIPVAAFLQLLYTDYYLQSKWYLGSSPPPEELILGKLEPDDKKLVDKV